MSVLWSAPGCATPDGPFSSSVTFGRTSGDRALLADVLRQASTPADRPAARTRLEEALGCSFTRDLLGMLAGVES
jgi:hypothetical protein